MLQLATADHDGQVPPNSSRFLEVELSPSRSRRIVTERRRESTKAMLSGGRKGAINRLQADVCMRACARVREWVGSLNWAFREIIRRVAFVVLRQGVGSVVLQQLGNLRVAEAAGKVQRRPEAISQRKANNKPK